MSRKQVAILMVAIIVGLLAVTWLRMRETSDAVICDELDQFYEEFQELRKRQASADEWDEFSQRTSATTAPHLAELKRTATSLRPIRQRLLFLTRDHLPDMLKTARQNPTRSEQAFEVDLADVHTMLSGELPEFMQNSGDGVD